ncbi:TPA: hypothetical protein SMR42_002452 [Pseudomonas putida]|nr:hypothetical protein [Pseudomonas putida]
MYADYENEIEQLSAREDITLFYFDNLGDLTEYFPQITTIYLFGSRRYPHQSLRSDIDILVVTDAYIKSSDIRRIIARHPALDVFTVDGGKATSCANESYVEAASFEDLIARLDAVEIWSRANDYTLPAGLKPFFEIRADIDFKMTAMPNDFFKPESFDGKIKAIEALGLPISPIIGETVEDAAEFLASIAQRIVFPKGLHDGSRGQAKSSWVTNLKSEYDFQDLFEIVCKPFLPNLAREEVTIHYDNKKKLSDFSFFDSQVVIEMKHVNSNAKASEVVKTLAGLTHFYRKNANVRVLLFIIYVDAGVSVDDRKWETDYSYYTSSPKVITKVIRNP